MASPVFWIKAAHPVYQDGQILGIDHLGDNVYKVRVENNLPGNFG